MCENKVSYHIPRGYSTRQVFVRCGNTDHHGNRAVCDACAADPAKRTEIDRQERMVAEDNAASHSAGWGDW